MLYIGTWGTNSPGRRCDGRVQKGALAAVDRRGPVGEDRMGRARVGGRVGRCIWAGVPKVDGGMGCRGPRRGRERARALRVNAGV